MAFHEDSPGSLSAPESQLNVLEKTGRVKGRGIRERERTKGLAWQVTEVWRRDVSAATGPKEEKR